MQIGSHSHEIVFLIGEKDSLEKQIVFVGATIPQRGEKSVLRTIRSLCPKAEFITSPGFGISETQFKFER